MDMGPECSGVEALTAPCCPQEPETALESARRSPGSLQPRKEVHQNHVFFVGSYCKSPQNPLSNL